MILRRDIVEHGVGQKPLQLGVLVLECLQTLGFRNVHPAELRLPGVELGAADPVLTADIGGRNTRLLLTQHGNDLLFRKPRSLHGPVLPSVRTPASSEGHRRGHSRRTNHSGNQGRIGPKSTQGISP
jgi:hypothetical protein